MTTSDPQPGSGPPPGPQPGPQPGQRREQAKKVGRALGTGARGTGKVVAGVARGTGRFSRFTLRQARRAASAEGADRSGLSRLIEMHAFNTAGDAAVAISLAGTLFFQVPTGEARGQVALFLGLTMLPFAIVAPLLGPFLDRFSHGRRWAIGATMAIRAFLVWGLATAVTTESTWLFPLALGCLVSSKAYGVTRAAAVPRLLPESLTLVKANGRISLAGVVAASVSAPIAGVLSIFGPEWSLRYAFVLFVLATIWAIRLPSRVDSDAGEDEAVLIGSAKSRKGHRPRMRIPGTVSFALRANCGPRWLSGFLTMFMAFLLRENPIGDWRPEVLLGIVIGAAGLGNTLGHRARVPPEEPQPGPHRRARPAGRRGDGAAGRVLLRHHDAGAARPDGGPGAVTRQAVARLHDPARRPRTGAHQRLRPQRHHAPAGVGDRRLRRHRAAAQPHPRPRRRQRGPGGLGGGGAGEHAQPDASDCRQ